MRMPLEERNWLDKQVKLMRTNRAKLIFHLFRLYQNGQVPSKVLYLIQADTFELVGDTWSDVFTGTVRVIISTGLVNAIEYKLDSCTFSQFKDIVKNSLN